MFCMNMLVSKKSLKYHVWNKNNWIEINNMNTGGRYENEYNILKKTNS